jgi:hypothetical protein
MDGNLCGAIWHDQISPHKSASVYECFRFIWPYNAQTAELASLLLIFAN